MLEDDLVSPAEDGSDGSGGGSHNGNPDGPPAERL
jgi:hypothetical protein